MLVGHARGLGQHEGLLRKFDWVHTLLIPVSVLNHCGIPFVTQSVVGYFGSFAENVGNNREPSGQPDTTERNALLSSGH